MTNTAHPTEPPTETFESAVGPNPEGLTHQAREAQRRADDELPPDPAATARRQRARKAAKKAGE